MTFEKIATRLRRPEGRRFMVFLLTGGVAAAVNVLSRVVFDLVMPYEVAVLVAYAVGMTTAFLLARLFVFAGELTIQKNEEWKVRIAVDVKGIHPAGHSRFYSTPYDQTGFTPDQPFAA